MESKSLDFLEKVITGFAVLVTCIISVIILSMFGKLVVKWFPTVEFRGLEYFVFPVGIGLIILACYIVGKLWYLVFPSSYDGSDLYDDGEEDYEDEYDH